MVFRRFSSCQLAGLNRVARLNPRRLSITRLREVAKMRLTTGSFYMRIKKLNCNGITFIQCRVMETLGHQRPNDFLLAQRTLSAGFSGVCMVLKRPALGSVVGNGGLVSSSTT